MIEEKNQSFFNYSSHHEDIINSEMNRWLEISTDEHIYFNEKISRCLILDLRLARQIKIRAPKPGYSGHFLQVCLEIHQTRSKSCSHDNKIKNHQTNRATNVVHVLPLIPSKQNL